LIKNKLFNAYLLLKLKLNIHNTIFKLGFSLLATIQLCFLFKPELQAQANLPKPNQIIKGFGYSDKGDSVEFIFGQQKKIIVMGVEVLLEKRINEINQVNVAGDFNGWNPDVAKFQMKKVNGNLFALTVSKSAIGEKGEQRQFKFVLNHKYWVEPPQEAQNKFTGKDGNTNLTLKL
jgi:hypothetical protein